MTDVVSVAQRQLTELFDNEAIWDAEDTDDYIVKTVNEFEKVLNIPVSHMRDLGQNSLLHMASIWNRPKVMEALIRCGAELNEKNMNGHTALDLAMHYGNIDLGQQLRHYGGKHTCESERDLALAQRDLAQHQIRDCESELHSAVQSLKRAKQDREEMRVERDRLVQANAVLTADRNELAELKNMLELAVSTLQREKQQLQLIVAQTTGALETEQKARENAVQSWQIAQHVISELQDRETGLREQEEEAIRLRSEALQDREIAREVARIAQIDQGLAKQSQIEAEHEREKAIKKLLEAELAIATEHEQCVRKVTKAEMERRNIQIEIDRQTERLRAECDRLDKLLSTANALTCKQQDQLTQDRNTINRLETRITQHESQQLKLENINCKLEEEVRILLNERTEEHKKWRDRLETKLRQAIYGDLRCILGAVIATWECLEGSHERARSITTGTLVLMPSTSESITSENNSIPIPQPKVSPMRTKLQSRPTTTPLLVRPSRLPILQDQKLSMQEVSSMPLLPVTETLTPLSPNTNDTDAFSIPSWSNDFAKTHVMTAKLCMNQLEGDHINSTLVAKEITAMTAAVQEFLNAFTIHYVKHMRHFRKQIEVLEKMVERKDELIARFNQHRLEKQKSRQAARLRECMYKPIG